MGEIQQCWNMIPKQMRADAATVDLKLEVNEAGVVTDIDLVGDVGTKPLASCFRKVSFLHHPKRPARCPRAEAWSLRPPLWSLLAINGQLAGALHRRSNVNP